MYKLILLDIDGVITDGKLTIDKDGNELKEIDFKDVDAIFKAKRHGFSIGFITGESTPITNYFNKRFEPDYFYNGCKNKAEALMEIVRESGSDISQVCYVGDSLHDIEAIELAGLGVAPANAAEEVKNKADLILKSSGGNGAIKEVVDYLLVIKTGAASYNRYAETFKKAYDENLTMMSMLEKDAALLSNIYKAAALVEETLRRGRLVMFCGNGGSAADAQHLATELVSRFYLERIAFNAEALTTNTSALTAIGNDYDFEKIFSRQVEAKGRAGDLLIGITTSGSSANVVEAMKAAKQKNIQTIALTGSTENMKVEYYSDIILKIPSTSTPRIQEAHIFIGHFICEVVESKLFDCGTGPPPVCRTLR